MISGIFSVVQEQQTEKQMNDDKIKAGGGGERRGIIDEA